MTVSTQFEQIRRSFEEAYARMDAAAVADLFAHDGWDFLFNGEHAKGHEAVKKQMAHRFELLQTAVGAAGIRLNTTPSHTQVGGDLAYEIGAFTITTADGSPVMEGDYTVVAKKVLGEWKLASHMTTGLPMAPAATGEPVAAA